MCFKEGLKNITMVKKKYASKAVQSHRDKTETLFFLKKESKYVRGYL
jgi:hypothetical protein